MVGEESVMEENTQVKKEEAEILENAQQNGEKKWKKYVRISAAGCRFSNSLFL